MTKLDSCDFSQDNCDPGGVFDFFDFYYCTLGETKLNEAGRLAIWIPLGVSDLNPLTDSVLLYLRVHVHPLIHGR